MHIGSPVWVNVGRYRLTDDVGGYGYRFYAQNRRRIIKTRDSRVKTLTIKQNKCKQINLQPFHGLYIW